MRRPTTTPLILAAAAYTLAGGYVHLREWVDTYRFVPDAIDGAAVVRIGFPLNAGLSLVVALALVITAFRLRRAAPFVVGAAIAFQASSLVALILSRIGNVFGWAEPVWTRGASQARAVEICALLLLAAFVGLGRIVDSGSRNRLRSGGTLQL